MLENVGPIAFLDLTFPFNEDATPKPIVLVGKNGTGKSILLSYIVDALIELAKLHYEDILIGQQFGISPFFKISGILNQRFDSTFGIGLLEFFVGDKKFSYVDKTGTLDRADYSAKSNGRFSGVWSWEKDGNYKKCSENDKADLETIFKQNSICYFLSNRKELPHWLNKGSISKDLTFAFEENLIGVLGKPIYIESCVDENKKWVLDVFLDSKVDFEELTGSDSARILKDKRLLIQSRTNIESLLKKILEDESTKLGLSYRSNMNNRLHIRRDAYLIPSLDHLSSGQSILFNIFSTIIRYADKGNINKSIKLNEIEGIVVIDEIDAHLDTELQYDILPKILKQFPRVQFILTTHSPLFLLGMEKEYGKDGFEIIEMPSGKKISVERFSEFQKSFDHYKNTRAYEEEISKYVLEAAKPTVLMEGETDPDYIKSAFKAFDRFDLLDKLNIDWIGSYDKRGAFNTGKDALNSAKDFLLSNPSLIKSQKILLLYDFDTRKPDEDFDHLWIRSILENETNTLIKKGIENLLPLELFHNKNYPKGEEEFDRRFYTERIIPGDYGKNKIIPEFNKKEFCKWICEERNNKTDFVYFDKVINILKRFLASSTS